MMDASTLLVVAMNLAWINATARGGNPTKLKQFSEGVRGLNGLCSVHGSLVFVYFLFSIKELSYFVTVLSSIVKITH